MSREAMQQALDAIEDSGCKADLMAAADALRAALAEQAQPVALEDDEFLRRAVLRSGRKVTPPTPVMPQPLTERELELLDGMIEVQLHHAAQCDLMLARAGANYTMAARQKGWDMERVELLRKIKRMGVQR